MNWACRGIGAALLGAFACAPRGDLAGLRYLPNNLVSPSRPPPPSAPAAPDLGGFPAVLTLVQHAAAGSAGAGALAPASKSHTTVAMETAALNIKRRHEEVAAPTGKATPTPETPPVSAEDMPKSFSPSVPATPEPEVAAPAVVDGGDVNTSAAAQTERGAALGRFPVPPKSASDRQLAFHNAAAKVYERVFVDDLGDVRAVEALRQSLSGEAELRPMQKAWDPLLEQAQERAQKLQQIQGPLGKLRAAFGGARFDANLSIYRDIDMPSCRVAFKRAKEEAPDAVNVEVRIEPVGRKPFGEFEMVCQEGHNIALMERDFPALKGPPPLRNLVRKAYQQAFSGTAVLKITVVGGGWKKGNGERTLKATVGVRRQDAFPLDECVMEQVVLHQTKTGRKWSETECCDVESSVAIACEAIE